MVREWVADQFFCHALSYTLLVQEQKTDRKRYISHIEIHYKWSLVPLRIAISRVIVQVDA